MLAGGVAARDPAIIPRVWDDRGALVTGVLVIVLAALAWIGVLGKAASARGSW